ncbi:GNAT family N-acetyltransferase [Candidatus Woesearchaeota archaeon]|jgi:GNAT superfamily N-acetyltransferase|nr:GNAT family N-acetyltransferase [Candidatus Woesearchaeota archaeon]MBT4150690.1 GNAT family N-acetyltransferase [Candidatus Woesearchaeota archaeon]MBT4247908.1 GNAT family N-acetyltransferase [Candidatus Woesearchaeota archaeon]MBT4434332.1 GNAT family N-acetyltransferase [Candidatus Woesearchaeota archaeon]MBT7332279.1 GNAT family N-acetyltransferase [Candidatus Woesearchaeota archaeon]
MDVIKKEVLSKSIRISLEENGDEVGRIFLQFIVNDLHQKPYAMVEDLFVHEMFRGKGYSKVLVEKVIETAKEHGCHKLIATSRLNRNKLHEYYQRFGFKEHGKEFRIDF